MTDTIRKPQSNLHKLVAERLSKAKSKEEREAIQRDVMERYRMLAELQPEYADRWNTARQGLEPQPQEQAEASPLLGAGRDEREGENEQKLRRILEVAGWDVDWYWDRAESKEDRIKNLRSSAALGLDKKSARVVRLEYETGANVPEEHRNRIPVFLAVLHSLETGTPIEQSWQEVVPKLQKGRVGMGAALKIGTYPWYPWKKFRGAWESLGGVGALVRGRVGEGVERIVRGIEKAGVGFTHQEAIEFATGESAETAASRPTDLFSELLPDAPWWVTTPLNIAAVVAVTRGVPAGIKAVDVRTGLKGAQRRAIITHAAKVEKALRGRGMSVPEARAASRVMTIASVQTKAHGISPKEFASFVKHETPQAAEYLMQAQSVAKDIFPGTFARLKLHRWGELVRKAVTAQKAHPMDVRQAIAGSANLPTGDEMREILDSLGKSPAKIVAALKKDKNLLGSIVAYIATQGTQDIPALSEIAKHPKFAALIQKTKLVAYTVEDARPPVKRAVREVTGQAEPPVEIAPGKLLKYALQHEARGARVGWLSGQLDMQDTTTNLVEWAEDHLPKSEFHRIKTALKHQRTPADRRQNIEALNRIQLNYDRADAISTYKKVVKGMKVEKWRVGATKEKAQALLKAVSVTEPSTQTLRVVTSLQSHLARSGYDPAGGDITAADARIPWGAVEHARLVLEQAGATLLRKLPPDSIRAVANSLAILNTAAKLKDKLYQRGELKQDTVLKKGMVNAASRKPVRKARTEAGAITERRPIGYGGRTFRLNEDMMTRHEDMFGAPKMSYGDAMLDKNAGKVPVADQVMWDVMEAERSGARLRVQIGDDLNEAIASVGYTPQQWSKAYARIRDLKKKFQPKAFSDGTRAPEATLDDWIDALNSLKDPKTRAELFRHTHEGGHLEGAAGVFKLTPEQWQELPGLLPKDVVKAADITFQLTQKYGSMLMEGHKTKYGTYPPGYESGRPYWPQRRSWEMSKDKAARRYRDIHRRFDSMSSLMPRVERSNTPIRFGSGFNKLERLLNQLEAFTTRSDVGDTLWATFNDPVVRKELVMRNKYPAEMMRDYNRMIEHFRALAPVEKEPGVGLANVLLRLGHKGALSLRPHIWIFQTLSFDLIKPYVSYKNWAKHRGDPLLRAPKKDLAELREHAPLLHERFSMPAQQLMSGYGQRGSTDARFNPEKQAWAKLKGITAKDRDTIVAIYRTMKDEAAARGLRGNEALDWAGRMTEWMMRRNQPANLPTAMSTRQLNAPKSLWSKISVQFRNFRMKQYNEAYRLYRAMRDDPSTVNKRKFVETVAATLVNNVSAWAIRTGWYWGLGTLAGVLIHGVTPEKRKKRSLLAQAAWRVADSIFSAVPGAGHLASWVLRLTEAKINDWDIERIDPELGIVYSSVKNTAEAANKLYDGIVLTMSDERYGPEYGPKMIGKRKGTQKLLEAAQTLLRGPGLFLPLPSVAVSDVIRFTRPYPKDRNFYYAVLRDGLSKGHKKRVMGAIDALGERGLDVAKEDVIAYYVRWATGKLRRLEIDPEILKKVGKQEATRLVQKAKERQAELAETIRRDAFRLRDYLLEYRKAKEQK